MNSFQWDDLPPTIQDGIHRHVAKTKPAQKLTGTLGCVVAVRDMDKTGLKTSDVAVLQFIASRANEENKAWPSQAAIARGIGASVSTVKRAIEKMALMDLFAVEAVKTDQDMIRFNRYTLNLSFIESKVSVHP